jgi:arylsulfatase A-like enzyme
MLQLVAALALAGLVPAAGGATNVILLMADDQGWGDVGFNPHIYRDPTQPYDWQRNSPRTPHLDALASSENSIVFWRFYAGSALCSPTRSAAMTGRTANRECISGPEPHGYGPSWDCFSPMPLSPRTFTIAEAAQQANFATFHAGKWHLGDFFPKGPTESSNFANRKWPVSHPGIHGFDDWHSTEASGPSSTPNCGCDASWPAAQQGCVSGGGEWHSNRSWVCMNYWRPNVADDRHACHHAHNSTLDCVSNLTSKITGDDAEHIIDELSTFLDKHSSTAAGTTKPFFAVLWLHTIHLPRGALPQWFHNYTDTFNDPAGDYLGSISQMDVQIGRLQALLRERGDDTMLWYTADNGPDARAQVVKGEQIVSARDRSDRPELAATNGLRQCKGSLFEGGTRVPGILHWPARISQNVQSWHPAYVSDYLPTFLDLVKMSHPQPHWAADGMSLLPLITLLGAPGGSTSEPRRPSEHPLVFELGGQAALIDNDMKILANPAAGHCVMANGSLRPVMLFNLTQDPTESVDLSESPAYMALFQTMQVRLSAFQASVKLSAVQESQCAAPPDETSTGVTTEPSVGGIMPQCDTPLKHWGVAPPPPVPSRGEFLLRADDGMCLTAVAASERATVTMAPCVTTAPADRDAPAGAALGGGVQNWTVNAADKVFLANSAFCAKPNYDGRDGCAAAGAPIWLGETQKNMFHVAQNDSTIQLDQKCNIPMCLVRNISSIGGGEGVNLGRCSDPGAQGWARVPL